MSRRRTFYPYKTYLLLHLRRRGRRILQMGRSKMTSPLRTCDVCGVIYYGLHYCPKEEGTRTWKVDYADCSPQRIKEQKQADFDLWFAPIFDWIEKELAK